MRHLICDGTSNGHRAGDLVEIGSATKAQLAAWGCVALPCMGDGQLDYSSLKLHGEYLTAPRSSYQLERRAISHSLYAILAGDYKIHIAARVAPGGSGSIVLFELWADGGPIQMARPVKGEPQIREVAHAIVPVELQMPVHSLAIKFAVTSPNESMIEWTAATIAPRGSL